MEEVIKNEIATCLRPDYPLGKFLYLGMARKNGRKVCVAVAYKMNYCIKKLDQFLSEDTSLELDHISKIRVGELKACTKFKITKPYNKYYL